MTHIKTNKIRCLLCNTTIESITRYDMKYCKCGKVAIDGGKEYLRRIGCPKNCEELSEYEEVEP